jgi:hypothetical protein
MKYSSKDVVLLIDGYNVLGAMTELTHAAEALTEEVTGLGETWEEHEYIGVQRAEISQSGYFDDASLSVNDAFNGKQGDKRVVCFGVEGNTAGKAFVGLNGALETRFERVASVKGLHKANVGYVVSGKSEDGKILLAYRSRTLTETPNPLRSTTAQRPQVAPTCICRSRRLTLTVRTI